VCIAAVCRSRQGGTPAFVGGFTNVGVELTGPSWISIDVNDTDRNGWPGGSASGARRDGVTNISLARP
jgi:hypothetical protein